MSIGLTAISSCHPIRAFEGHMGIWKSQKAVIVNRPIAGWSRNLLPENLLKTGFVQKGLSTVAHRLVVEPEVGSSWTALNDGGLFCGDNEI